MNDHNIIILVIDTNISIVIQRNMFIQLNGDNKSVGGSLKYFNKSMANWQH